MKDADPFDNAHASYKGFTFGYNGRQPVYKIIPVDVVQENFPSFDPPAYDVVQRTGGIYSGFSGHLFLIYIMFWLKRIISSPY
jgi:hypothetical protein